jgi:DUF1016 N-terminal domain
MSIEKQNKIEKTDLVSDIKSLIEQSKQQIAVAVNATITMLYWNIGKRINENILKDQRAEYGKQINSPKFILVFLIKPMKKSIA